MPLGGASDRFTQRASRNTCPWREGGLRPIRDSSVPPHRRMGSDASDYNESFSVYLEEETWQE